MPGGQAESEAVGPNGLNDNLLELIFHLVCTAAVDDGEPPAGLPPAGLRAPLVRHVASLPQASSAAIYSACATSKRTPTRATRLHWHLSSTRPRPRPRTALAAANCRQPPPAAAAAPQVCRRWHRVYSDSDLLWGEFHMDWRAALSPPAWRAHLASPAAPAAPPAWAPAVLTLASFGYASRWLHARGARFRRLVYSNCHWP
jgi:hypothetical protein